MQNSQGQQGFGRVDGHAARRGGVGGVHDPRCGPGWRAWSTGPWWTGGCRAAGHGGGAMATPASSPWGATGHGKRQRGHGRVARAEPNAVRMLAARESGRGGRAARWGGSTAAEELWRARVRERKGERAQEGHGRGRHLAANAEGRLSSSKMR